MDFQSIVVHAIARLLSALQSENSENLNCRNTAAVEVQETAAILMEAAKQHKQLLDGLPEVQEAKPYPILDVKDLNTSDRQRVYREAIATQIESFVDSGMLKRQDWDTTCFCLELELLRFFDESRQCSNSG
jgi:hypothetical protein